MVMPSPPAKYGGVWLVFALVIVWKVLLFSFSAQPVPSNDAYFYDGAVVNQLHHGGYFNPTIARAMPISGKRVFSAYPPLYQALLWLWMSAFGTSAISAMALHLVLFAAYALTVLAILYRLQMPVWCIHIAGFYLFLLTFHDRPDSLAHLLGMLAVYSWIRSRRNLDLGAAPLPVPWVWAMVAFTILALCTSLQIGAIYFLWIWIGMLATSLAGGEKFPLIPMSMLLIVPVVLVAAVRIGFPELWDGFMEHARQTPSLTGWRMPTIPEVLKVLRTTPGILFVAITLPGSWLKQHNNVATAEYARFELILIPALLSALAVVAACLFLLTANTVAIANYLQPVIVACYLAFCGTLFAGNRWLRLQITGLWLAVLLGSIRAIGMSTWGLACAADVGYPTAIHRVEQELSTVPPGAAVVLSSAFLYEASKYNDLTVIHSDWMQKAKANPPISDLQALLALKPRKVILTQFDYYRRYQPTLDQLKSDPSLKDIQIINVARVRPPDAFPSLQRVVQHVSWAPIIVNLFWADPSQPGR